MQDTEPIASNILDAINFMKKILEQHQAVIEGTPILNRCYKLNRYLPLKFTTEFIIPAIIAVAITIVSWLLYGYVAGMITGAIVWYLISMAINELSKDYFSSISWNKKLAPILADLERLYQYNDSMDVGFGLQPDGNIDFVVLESMIKKRKKEIRDRAKNAATWRTPF